VDRRGTHHVRPGGVLVIWQVHRHGAVVRGNRTNDSRDTTSAHGRAGARCWGRCVQLERGDGITSRSRLRRARDRQPCRGSDHRWRVRCRLPQDAVLPISICARTSSSRISPTIFPATWPSACAHPSRLPPQRHSTHRLSMRPGRRSRRGSSSAEVTGSSRPPRRWPWHSARTHDHTVPRWLAPHADLAPRRGHRGHHGSDRLDARTIDPVQTPEPDEGHPEMRPPIEGRPSRLSR
jgi:hypothetical protein